jgi:hypothetical protein
MAYKLHVYRVVEDSYNYNVYTYVRREDEEGNFDVLRCGLTTKPDWLVKTGKQLGVESFMYDMTEEQLDRNAWDEAKLIPEEEW